MSAGPRRRKIPQQIQKFNQQPPAARERARGSPRGFGHAKEKRRANATSNPPSEPGMANSKPLMAESSGTVSANAAVQSALRTLDAEGSGITAMSAESESTLSKAADIALTLPKAREACPHNLAPTTSSLMMLALGDALAIALLEGRGFTSVDFSVLHPGGKLGAMLKFVRDLMHTGAAVPLKPLGTKMSDALVEMSAKGFGCVGIIDANGDLVGIITDGDLRRHMRPDLMTAAVDEVMTKNPKTTTPDTLAVELLDTVNSSQPRITVLIVAEGRKPVGIVHVHDVLRAGVA